MSAYHRLVGKQLAEVQEAQKKHRPVKPILERNKEAINAQLRKEVRFRKVKMTLKRAVKWLKGGV